MIRMLHVVSVLALSLAGALLGLCVRQWCQGPPPLPAELELSALQRFQASHGVAKSDEAQVNPLVREAERFALYLTPARPAAPRETRPSPLSAIGAAPAIRPAGTTPQFTLLSTSYCRGRPEKSWALIASPGAEGRWIRAGEQVGHVTIERIAPGTMIYHDGNQSREMKVTAQDAAPLARLRSTAPVAKENHPLGGIPPAQSQLVGGGSRRPDAPPAGPGFR
jgi:hypothetical protein